MYYSIHQHVLIYIGIHPTPLYAMFLIFACFYFYCPYYATAFVTATIIFPTSEARIV